MTIHPDVSMPEDQLRGAYTALLATLARDEPEALRRAVQALDADAAKQPAMRPGSSPGARLARSWLAFAESPEAAPIGEGQQVFTFAYPALVAFQVASERGTAAAQRKARRIVASLLESDQPLTRLVGPLPAEPGIIDLVVWLGSRTGQGDEIELELIGG